jgi:hypothetical protein
MAPARHSSGGRWMTLLIVLGLAAWGAYLATGAYLFNHNPWRGVVILGCVATFIGGWFWLLRTRR